MSERAEPRSQQRKKAFIVGVFIFGILGLLIYTVFWVKNFSLRPNYGFYARFIEPPYINKGAPVYFRGLKVGSVSNIQLSEDNSAVLVHINIYQDNLKLPLNTEVTVHTEGITGIVYLGLNYPSEEKPSPYFISEGVVVEGQEPLSFDKLQRILARLAEKGELEKMVSDAQTTLRELKGTVRDIRQAARKTSEFMDQANSVSHDSKQLMADWRGTAQKVSTTVDEARPLLKQSLKSFETSNRSFQSLVGGAGNALGKGNPLGPVRQAADEVSKTFSYLRSELQNTGMIRNVGESAKKIGSITDQATSALEQVSGAGKTGLSFLKEVPGTITNVNQAAQRFDCIQTGVADMLSQRFLLFRLAFGKPGAAIEACKSGGWLQPPGLQPPSLQNVSQCQPKAMPLPEDCDPGPAKTAP